MKKNIFISYDTKDKNKMCALSKAIEGTQRQFSSIIVADRRNPSSPLADKVVKGLEEANYIVPILTRNSIKSQWVNQEIGYATAIKRKIFPIVDNAIAKDLKGFIHHHLDLPFKFDSFPSNPHKEAWSFRKCSEGVLEHLFTITPKSKNLSIKKAIDTSMLKRIMASLPGEYALGHTELLAPDTKNKKIQTHSHIPNGYFDYLRANNCKKYSFKYFDNMHRDRYFEMYINNDQPTCKVKLHLTQKENEEIGDRLVKAIQ